MYTLSDQQIEFISDDIRARGIALVSLQHDLLDHICCLIEDTFEEGDDFESFYRRTISTFYKKELGEIEEETIRMLTFKHYHHMKKIMMGSGVVSVALLTTGIALKFLHLPGAAVVLFTGAILLSFLFLPVLFLLKMKERQRTADRFILGFGAISAILVSTGILFKMMHWPGANVMIMSSLGVLLLLFLPVYFFTGIRMPERKVNTIVSSMLIVAGSGLLLMLIRIPASSRTLYLADTEAFVRNERLLTRLRAASPVSGPAGKLLDACESLKQAIVENQTGAPSIPSDFATRYVVLGDGQVGDMARVDAAKFESLRNALADYNQTAAQPISEARTLLDTPQRRLSDALSDLTRIEMEVLLQQRTTAMN